MAKKSAKRSPSPGKKTPGKKTPGKKTAKRPGARPTKKVYGKRAAPKPGPWKRRPKSPPAETAPREDGERLQKVLAAAGIGSRRGCEELILEGRVQIDGEVISELGARVDTAKQTIHVDGEVLLKPKLVYFAVNKPTGVVCTAKDPSGRPRVTDLLPPSVGRVFNVGRLDMSSEGLILLTNDGDLANKLTHPRHGVEKLYHVTVAGDPTPETLAEVRKGVYLDEGRVAFSNVRVKSRKKTAAVLEVVLDEGRNREIRRVLARVGHKVQKLVRIAVGPVRLGEMPSGAYRPLKREELGALRAATAPKKPTKPAAADAETAEPTKRKRPRRLPAKPKDTPKPAAGRRVFGDVDKPASTAKPKRPAKRSPADKKPAGAKPTGRKPSGTKPSGRKLSGTKPAGKKPAGKTPYGKKTGGKPPGRKKR